MHGICDGSTEDGSYGKRRASSAKLDPDQARNV